MSEGRDIIGFRAVRRIATGEIVSAPSPIYVEDWPYRNISGDQVLLRYMDYWKFEDLFKTAELYFCRADKFADSLEGTLSPEDIHGTSASDRAFTAIPGRGHEAYQERATYRARAKACTFVSCWHMKDRPDRRMWDAYTKTGDSVLIVTTAARLAASLRQRVFASAVKYVSANTPRTEFDERSLFFYKDETFAFECEFRLIVDLLILGGAIREDDPNDFYRRFPVNLDTLIYGIQPHPDATAQTKAKIGELVSRFLPNARES